MVSRRRQYPKVHVTATHVFVEHSQTRNFQSLYIYIVIIIMLIIIMPINRCIQYCYLLIIIIIITFNKDIVQNQIHLVYSICGSVAVIL